MAKRYSSDKAVGVRYEVDRATIWRWANHPRYQHLGFPKPEKIGPNTSRWNDAKLDAWDVARDELKAAERYDAMAEEAEAGKDSEDEEDGEEE